MSCDLGHNHLKQAMLLILVAGAGCVSGCRDGEAKSFLTSRSVLGSDLAYVKQEFGDPVLNREGQPTYQVGGCDIQFGTAGTKITSYSTRLAGNCKLQIDEIEAQTGSTVGEILAHMEHAYLGVSCIDCGNAANPVFTLLHPGARYNGYVTVSFTSDYETATQVIREWSENARSIEKKPEGKIGSRCIDVVSPELLADAKMLQVNSAEVFIDETGYELSEGIGSSFCQPSLASETP